VGADIVYCGHGFGSRILSSESVEKSAGYSEGEISRLTGIESRYVCGNEESDLDLCSKAFSNLPNDLFEDIKSNRSIIISAISTGQYSFPSFSSQLQSRIGLSRSDVFSFDLNGACAGFQHACAVGAAIFNQEQDCKYMILVGVSAISKYIDWTGPGASLYFGDSAGVLILRRGALDFFLGDYCSTKSAEVMSVNLERGGEVKINGLEVWKQVVTHLPKAISGCLERANHKIGDIDWFVFHQANKHLIKFLMHRLGIPENKALVCVDSIGNTAEGSIPTALSVFQDCFKPGDLVILAGVGAGYHTGASLIKWNSLP